MTKIKLLKLSGLTLCFTLLLALGGCSKQRPPSINNDLLLAVGLDNTSEVIRLLDKGADVNSQEDDTPLYVAANLGRKDIAELLISRGAKIDGKGDAKSGNRTPLHAAALRGSRDVAALLLSQGADINAKDVAGATPLHFAAREGRKDVAELLIAKGADINAMDKDGRTPLAYSRDKKRFLVTEILKQHNAK